MYPRCYSIPIFRIKFLCYLALSSTQRLKPFHLSQPNSRLHVYGRRSNPALSAGKFAFFRLKTQSPKSTPPFHALDFGNRHEMILTPLAGCLSRHVCPNLASGTFQSMFIKRHLRMEFPPRSRQALWNFRERFRLKYSNGIWKELKWKGMRQNRPPAWETSKLCILRTARRRKSNEGSLESSPPGLSWRTFHW